jgi:hypothetical protein
MRLLYAYIAHVKNKVYADAFVAYSLSACVIGYEERSHLPGYAAWEIG